MSTVAQMNAFYIFVHIHRCSKQLTTYIIIIKVKS